MHRDKNEPVGYDNMGAPIYAHGLGLNFEPGSPDGPPKPSGWYRLGQGFGYVVLLAMLLGAAWVVGHIVRFMFTHSPF